MNIAEYLRLHDKILKSPFITADSLLRFVHLRTAGQAMHDVPVSRIISAPGIDCWQAYRRSEEYMIEMINDIASGSFNLDKSPVELNEYDGIYIVQDGTHRCIAAKILGLQTIPAKVLRTVPDQIIAHTPADYVRLIQRRKRGLWSGDVTPNIQAILSIKTHAAGIIKDYAGAWAFASDNLKAEQLILQARAYAPNAIDKIS